MRKKLLLGVSLAVLPAMATFAQSPESSKPHSPIMPVKIKPQQGGADSMSRAAAEIQQEDKTNPEEIGLPFKPTYTNLRPSLWQGMSRAEMKARLDATHAPLASPTLFNLLKQAVAIAPDISIRGAEESEQPADTFSGRLRILSELGAFEEALQLYKMLDGNIPSAEAAKAGVTAMVGTGQMGLACLEDKAIDANLKNGNDTLWSDLNTICGLLFSSMEEDDTLRLKKAASGFVTAKRLPIVNDIKSLNDKSAVEVLAASRAGQISPALYVASQLRLLTPSVIKILSSDKSLSPAQQLSLLTIAIEKGLQPVADLDAAYKAQSGIATTIETPGTLGQWQQFLSSYAKLRSLNSGDAKTAELKSVLKNPEISTAALLPLANEFASATPTGFTKQEVKAIATVLILANHPGYDAWLKALSNQAIDSASTNPAMSGYELLMNTYNVSAQADETNQKDRAGSQSFDFTRLQVSQPFITGTLAAKEKPVLSYENILNLTGSGDYVMPSDALTEDLQKAVAQQQTGKVVLLAQQVLDGKSFSEIHPASVFLILDSLKTVGLSEEANAIAREALADFIKK